MFRAYPRLTNHTCNLSWAAWGQGPHLAHIVSGRNNVDEPFIAGLGAFTVGTLQASVLNVWSGAFAVVYKASWSDKVPRFSFVFRFAFLSLFSTFVTGLLITIRIGLPYPPLLNKESPFHVGEHDVFEVVPPDWWVVIHFIPHVMLNWIVLPWHLLINTFELCCPVSLSTRA